MKHHEIVVSSKYVDTAYTLWKRRATLNGHVLHCNFRTYRLLDIEPEDQQWRVRTWLDKADRRGWL